MAIHENPGDRYLDVAKQLNKNNSFTTLSLKSLANHSFAMCDLNVLLNTLADSHPNLFATTPFFASHRQIEKMEELIHAIESVVALPAYKQAVLSWAPSIANFDPGSLGVFFGYDFHLDDSDPKLIEINSNAGGAMLNSLLARIQRMSSRAYSNQPLNWDFADSTEQAFVDMFRKEWRLQKGDAELRSIAIVDESPENQYLKPEFHLFATLFRHHGIEAFVADPSELKYLDGCIWYRDIKIDLIYNRLTDFPLDQVQHAHLKQAYLKNEIALTPHPRAHALYADKRNLTLLTNEEVLRNWGVSPGTRTLLLSRIPKTVIVTPENAQSLWDQRRHYFFKPFAGFGGKATYRGAKLTKRVWNEILESGYVAQELIPPSERTLYSDNQTVSLKVDIRNYVYDGCVQMLAARMYQGQTTNFRTTGGGFAAVFRVDDVQSHAYLRAGSNLGTPISINPFHLFNHGEKSIR